jgi:hypothetical protein
VWNRALQLVEMDDLLLQASDLRGHLGIDVVGFGSRAVAEGSKELLLHLRSNHR